MKAWRRIVAALLIGVAGAPLAEEAPGDASWLSEAGAFRVSFTSRLQPLEINRIHSWVLHVETAQGDVVDAAVISVKGGMPAHDHGLPTEPEVTRSLGEGDYLVEGLRFHMNGYWELEFTISAGAVVDTVVVPLTL